MNLQQPAVEGVSDRQVIATEGRPAEEINTRRLARLAWLLWSLSVALVAIGLTLTYVTSPSALIADLVVNTIGTPTILTYATVGALAASQRPYNPFGWTCCTVALLTAFGTFAEAYSRYAVLTNPDSLPGGEAMAWFVGWQFGTGICIMFTVVPLLFPNGRLPSKRWRAVAWVIVFALAVETFLDAFEPGNVTDSLQINNPLGIVDVPDIKVNFYGPLILVTTLICMSSVIVRFRSATGDERQQIKWFAYAASLTIVLFGFLFTVDTPSDLTNSLLVLAVSTYPIAAAIAILKYRLYDIDIIINRTLVYIPLTGILTGLYSASIALFQRLFMEITGEKSDAAVVLTTLVLASSFTPIKNGLQVVVDKRFKETPDPTKKLRSFGEQVKSFVELSSAKQITRRLLEEVVTAFGATGGAVYLWKDGNLMLTHATDDWQGDSSISVPLQGENGEIGILLLGSRAQGLGYKEDDLDVLREIADAVAGAVELRRGQSNSTPYAESESEPPKGVKQA